MHTTINQQQTYIENMKNPTSKHPPSHQLSARLQQLILQFIFIYLCMHSTRDHHRIAYAQTATVKTTSVNVGVILDLNTFVGSMTQTCLFMALSDFYSTQKDYKTRLVLHTRDSNRDDMDAASAAIDLLKNIQVQAILGPQKSSQAEFVVNIGNKTLVPIISFSATSPSLSFAKTPYFIRTALNDSAQVKAIASIVQAYGWRQIVPIYEDTQYGNDILPYLTDAIQDLNAKIPYRSVISSVATNDEILEELFKLKTMQTRVFVVHMSSSLGSRLFLKAKEVGMMTEGYVWIITDGFTGLLGSLNSTIIKSMQGVIGVKPYVPISEELDNFQNRWRRNFTLEHPNINTAELSIYGLWAYDSIRALAMAVEQIGDFPAPPFLKPTNMINISDIDLATIGISKVGTNLLQAILSTDFHGLSGEFKLMNGQLQSSVFEIINVIGKGARTIGFWTAAQGISNTSSLPADMKSSYSTSMDNLGAVVWPGDSIKVPKGWVLPTSGKKMRIGVPIKKGFKEFMKVDVDPQTKAVKVTGFCIDVFEAAMDSLPYAVPYEYVPYDIVADDYNNFVYQVYLKNFDAVVGDVTIVSNRTTYVDFTLPFTESGVRMIVPVKFDERKNPWIFWKPLNWKLWMTSAAFFIITGMVVWLLEHQENPAFQGSILNQLSMIFWFGFSTLVFAHRERVSSILSRFVLVIWVFVVMILTSSYTASLTSRLTVQQLRPTVTEIQELIKNGDYIGYQEGSFIKELFERKYPKLDPSKLKEYTTIEEYSEALNKGSSKGGVAAIIEELPYIRLFLAKPKYCTNYTVVGPTHQTAGFGFVFPKGSPMLADMSAAVLNVTQGDKMDKIAKAWFGTDPILCSEQKGYSIASDTLTLDSFKGLFYISAGASIFGVLGFLWGYWDVSNRIRTIWENLIERFNTRRQREEEQAANAGEIALIPGAAAA